MTLYDDIQKIEAEIARRQDLVKQVVSLGGSATLDVPHLYYEAREAIHLKYHNNPFIRRMNAGEDLEQMAEGLVKDRKVIWRNTAERKSYNRRVAEFAEIAGRARDLTVYSGLNPLRDVNLLWFLPTLFGGVAAGIGHFASSGSPADVQVESFLTYLFAGMGFVSALMVYIVPFHGSQREIVSSFYEQCHFIKNALERK